MSTITFEELKTKYENKLNKDIEVNCKILAKVKDGYIVDLNDEWEGFIPANHILEENLECTNSFKASILSGPDKYDRYLVSPRNLKDKAVWEKLEKLNAEQSVFKAVISKVVKGGVEIFIDSVRGFLPGRYLRLPGIAQENWVNQEIDVLIEELDQKEKKLILNQKKAIDVDKQRKAEATILKLKEGDVISAPVLRIADFGVFVDLGGLDGLIPASELSWGRYNHPKDIVKVGQEIKAIIFRIEKENQRVALSVKQLLGDPWNKIETQIQPGMLIIGTVINEAQFGLFVELKPGVEALLHNSEIPENMEKPKVGSTVTARLIKLDTNHKKIGLSLIDIEPNTPEELKTEVLTNGHSSDKDELSHLELPSISLEDLTLCSLENESEILNN